MSGEGFITTPAFCQLLELIRFIFCALLSWLHSRI